MEIDTTLVQAAVLEKLAAQFDAIAEEDSQDGTTDAYVAGHCVALRYAADQLRGLVRPA